MSAELNYDAIEQYANLPITTVDLVSVPSVFRHDGLPSTWDAIPHTWSGRPTAAIVLAADAPELAVAAAALQLALLDLGNEKIKALNLETVGLRVVSHDDGHYSYEVPGVCQATMGYCQCDECDPVVRVQYYDGEVGAWQAWRDFDGKVIVNRVPVVPIGESA